VNPARSLDHKRDKVADFEWGKARAVISSDRHHSIAPHFRDTELSADGSQSRKLTIVRACRRKRDQSRDVLPYKRLKTVESESKTPFAPQAVVGLFATVKTNLYEGRTKLLKVTRNRTVDQRAVGKNAEGVPLSAL
jgi:hypothetical protein